MLDEGTQLLTELTVHLKAQTTYARQLQYKVAQLELALKYAKSKETIKKDVYLTDEQTTLVIERLRHTVAEKDAELREQAKRVVQLSRDLNRITKSWLVLKKRYSKRKK